MGCWQRNGKRPLKWRKKEHHNLMSLWKSWESLHLADGEAREFIMSRIRRRKVRPPQTTRQAQLSFPARRCNCFLFACRLVWKEETSRCNFSSLFWGKDISHCKVLSSTPRKTSFWVGCTTLCHLMWNPRSWSSCNSLSKASWHSSLVLPMTKKSSR